MEENQNFNPSGNTLNNNNIQISVTNENTNPAQSININEIIGSNEESPNESEKDKSTLNPLDKFSEGNEKQKSEKIRKASCDLFEEKNEKSEEQKNLEQRREETSESQNFPDGENPGKEIERIKNTIIFEGTKYIGETLNGVRDGFGICEYNDGKTYIGQWVNDCWDGYGKIIYSNGDLEQGEFSNNKPNGFFEVIEKNKSTTKGFVNDLKFSDYISIERNNFIYEGEPQKEEKNKMSFGRLTYSKKGESKKVFIGDVYNYHTEMGHGMYYKDNNIFYCEIRYKKMINYIENYGNESGCFLGFTKDNKKDNMGIYFIKDGRICIGEFEDDLKKGPFFYFQNLPKPSVKMELYLMGFKTKTVEKIDTIKKYLMTYYPEYSNILKIDFQKFLDKISKEVNEEITNSAKLMESFKEDSVNY